MATMTRVGEIIRYSPATVALSLRASRRYPVVPVIIMLVVLVLPSIFADVVAPHDPIEAELSHRLEPPAWVGSKTTIKTVSQSRNTNVTISLSRAQSMKSGSLIGQTSHPDPQSLAVGDQVEIVDRAGGSWNRPLGTDKLGRDLLTRILYGARYSLYVSLAVICISGVIGTALGIMAAYFGGWVDYSISRLIDIFMALPGILVLLVLVVVIGPGLTALIAVISGLLWSRYARLVRGEVLGIKTQDFIAKAPRGWFLSLQNHGQAHIPQRVQQPDHPGHVAGRLRHHHRILCQFPWRRDSQAHSLLGIHRCGWPRPDCSGRVVDFTVLRSRDRIDRAVGESAGRLAPR